MSQNIRRYRTCFIFMFLLVLLAEVPAASQGKKPAPGKKSPAIPKTLTHDPAGANLTELMQPIVPYIKGHEVFGEGALVDLSSSPGTVQTIKEEKLEPGFCYRFFFVSAVKAVKYRMEIAEGDRILSQSREDVLGAAEYCTGKKEKSVAVRLSWKKKRGKVAFAAYRKSQAGQAQKDDLFRTLTGLKLGPPAFPPLMGVLDEKGKIDLTVPAPQGGCHLFVAAAGDGLHRVSLEVSGKKSPDAPPGGAQGPAVVEWCPPAQAPETLKVKIRALSGHGLFIFSIYSKGQVEPVGVGGKSSKELLIDRIHKFLGKMSPGMASTAQDGYFSVPSDEGLSVQVPVKSGVCYRMAATGDLGVTGIALKIKAGKGAAIAGKPVDQFVMADFCPQKSGKVGVDVTAAGAGGVGFSCFAGSPEAAVFSTGGAAFDLEKLLAKLDAAREKYGEGMDAADTPSTGILKYGQAAALEVAVDKDFCYKFIAVAGCAADCSIELSATKEGGTIVTDKPGSGGAVVEFCPDATFTAGASIKLAFTERGKEAFAFIPMRKTAKSKMQLYAAGESKKDYLAKRIIGKSKDACKGKSAVSPVLRKSLSPNETAVFDVKLAGEVCYTIVAVGEPSVKEIKVSLINPNGQEIARDDQTGPEAVLKTAKCPGWDGTYTVKVKMFLGYGKIGVQIFADM
jgi:hypothetical protein